MDHLEQELRKALRRQDPGTDFSASVRERIEREHRRKQGWLRIPPLRWAPAAVLCLAVLGGMGYRYEQQRQQTRGEAVRRQVTIALRIAGDKIRLAQDAVQGLSEQ